MKRDINTKRQRHREKGEPSSQAVGHTLVITVLRLPLFPSCPQCPGGGLEWGWDSPAG